MVKHLLRTRTMKKKKKKKLVHAFPLEMSSPASSTSCATNFKGPTSDAL